MASSDATNIQTSIGRDGDYYVVRPHEFQRGSITRGPLTALTGVWAGMADYPFLDGPRSNYLIDVAFLRRLRAEAVFSDVDELVAQIGRDVDQTLEIFKKFSPFGSALLE